MGLIERLLIISLREGFAHVKCTGRGPFESATVRIGSDGEIEVFTGAVAIGQGTKTILAQICGEILQVNYENINIVCGDTSKIEYGLGAFGSRQVAGSAVKAASMAVKEKILNVAAQFLAKDYSISFANHRKEIFLQDGEVCVDGRKDVSITFKEISLKAPLVILFLTVLILDLRQLIFFVLTKWLTPMRFISVLLTYAENGIC